MHVACHGWFPYQRIAAYRVNVDVYLDLNFQTTTVMVTLLQLSKGNNRWSSGGQAAARQMHM